MELPVSQTGNEEQRDEKKPNLFKQINRYSCFAAVSPIPFLSVGVLLR